MQDYQSYYQSLTKPFFAPEPWVFGFAWGIIYPMIAMAFVYTLYLWYQGQLPTSVLGVFVLNIAANLLFTPLQLLFPEAIWSSLDILVVLVSLLWLLYGLYQVSLIAFLLLVPYALWASFATVLQLSIYYLNFL